MQLPLLASTFITVFLAELGDKTQLAIVTISGTSNRTGAVFAGSATALVLASLLGAGAGGSLSAVIPTNALQLAASLGFLVIGTCCCALGAKPMQPQSPAPKPEPPAKQKPKRSKRSPWLPSTCGDTNRSTGKV